mgnify:CR=1 FL=1
MKKFLKIMTVYDFVLIIFILLISISFLFFPFWKNTDDKDGDKYIVISSDGKVIEEISVQNTFKKEPLIVKVKGPIGTSVIEAHKGKVRVKEAPDADPEKICEKTGWIETPGPSIICVPNKISIWIESKDSNLDGVSW